ncbi:oxidoreductase [Planctomycetaceae bacterium SCGC AG-212-F19]|nr:oxidoreductase [Planctomycetaceae bacterium SCGC AG-212-F19]
MSKLDNKTVLVTGGGSGIGLAVARLFLDAGARVAITGRDAVKLEKAAAGLKAGDRLWHAPCDATDPKQVAQLFERVKQKFGRIDILVNNAGMNIKNRTFRELTPESWDKMVRANLDSAFYCTHAVLPDMLQRKDGLIINISSIAGKRASPLGGPAYVAAKFGMTGLGMCLAAEEKDSGIRVTNIYPGEVDTPILEHRPTPVTEEHRQRILQPEDVAQAVLFVAGLPPRANVPELIIKPTTQQYI